MTRPRPRTALRTAKRVAERAHQKAARYARAGATIASPAFLPDELVIDLFAGGGGASCGIEAALGRPVDIAINHDAIAMAVHAANHPRTRHLISNVWEVDPVEACAGRRVGLLWASPDCFPAGTMVLTREGYRPIEQVEVGDEVLTHLRRWRRVTATMSTEKALLRLRGHGHPGLEVSSEHPFLARRRTDAWSPQLGRTERRLAPQEWVRANDLGPGWYWATPTEFPEDAPPAVPVVQGRATSVTSALLWLAGLYVADGWTRLTETRAEVVITCGKHEVDRLRERLGAWPRSGLRSASDEMVWHERETRTAYQFTVSHRGLVMWLRQHFGHGAADKLIPGWALGMSVDLRESLLAGYLSGDGSTPKADGTPIVQATTVSKALAFGVKALAESLGKTAAVYLREQNGSGTIQGRQVQTLPAWSIRWREDVDEAHRQTFREGGHEWAAVRERTDLDEVAEVFNLSVEDDESYVVEGIVVHNCTHHSRAKGAKPLSSKRRALASVVVRWARDVRPRVIVGENVAEFADWGPLDANGRPDPKKKGASFKSWVSKIVGRGYRMEWRMLRACDFGTPTTRARLFFIARCDGLPIVWPEPTHGPGRAAPFRTAAECLDLEDFGRSIFGRKKSLADATLRRIAAGIERYVINAQPFIVPLTHQGDARVHSVEDPVVTVTCAHRGELALATPVLFPIGYGERDGQAPRVADAHAPLATVVTNRKHALAVPVLVPHFGGANGNPCPPRPVTNPAGTVTTKDHTSLATAFMVKWFGTSKAGAPITAPLPTILTGGGKGGGHAGLVHALMIKYYGGKKGRAQTSRITDPVPTVVTKDRLGLVIVTIGGDDYQVVDIFLRMLKSSELKKAQGFADGYDLSAARTKTKEIALVGNSVCQQVAEALIRGNAPGPVGQLGLFGVAA